MFKNVVCIIIQIEITVELPLSSISLFVKLILENKERKFVDIEVCKISQFMGHVGTK